MKKFLSIAAIICAASFLSGCGGSAAAGIPVNSGVNETPMEQNNTGIAIERAATVNDGYEGGLKILRDTTGLSGGTRGFVNTASLNHTIAGENVDQFEWSHLSILDNYAKAGENVATYSQANKYGTGPTWAGVSEVADFSQSKTGVIAHEFDVWASGADTENRIGLDVVLGDVDVIRNQKPGSGNLGASAGLRIGTHASSPYAIWTRGIQLTGNYAVGIDTSSAKMTTAMRIGEGQAISLESTDTVKIKYSAGRIIFMTGVIQIMEIDVMTGDIYKKGVKVL